MPSSRTRMVRAGAPLESGVHPHVEPIYQSSAYAFDDSAQADDTSAAGRALYARDGLPNVRSLERAVADLEGADDAVAVASGMAAIATTVLALVQTGDHVLLGCRGYCETFTLLEDMRDRFQLRLTQVDLNDHQAVETAMTPQTRLVLAETISNPGMRLVDLGALSAITRRHGVPLIVDNTLATPVLCQPLALGADGVIHSAGKFLAGHGDVTAGIVAGGRELVAQLKRSAHLYGPLLAPMEAWLTLRGIRTLLPRVTWASQSAAQVAGWLRDHPAVEHVDYVGLAGHEQAELARCMLPRGAGSVLTFRLKDGERAGALVVHHLRTIPYVPSIGGASTIVSFPPRSPRYDATGMPVATPHRNATVRLSIGLEDPLDIIADLDQALALVGHATDSPDPLRSLS
jgi:cystathionine beta-lyase/cystathionine gamma-synthase